MGGDAAYSSWLEKHPSALDSFEGIIRSVGDCKNLVLFLDYDGTLSPIVNDPDKAFMSQEMRSALREVANLFPTAIVSGRCIDKLNGFVQLENVMYAGSHGMDIWTSSGSLKFEKGKKGGRFQPALEFLSEVKEIIGVLKKKIKSIEGAIVEDNMFCASVHYRCVHEEDVETVKDIVTSVIKDYPSFNICGGKKVMEIRPTINWDKGRALEYLLETFGFNNSSNFIPLYIGDDKTDEDAFKVIRRLGKGFPIIVSSHQKETKATYSLRDPEEVKCFLLRLTKWKQVNGT